MMDLTGLMRSRTRYGHVTLEDVGKAAGMGVHARLVRTEDPGEIKGKEMSKMIRSMHLTSAEAANLLLLACPEMREIIIPELLEEIG